MALQWRLCGDIYSRRMLWYSRRMLWLTVVLMVLTAIQATRAIVTVLQWRESGTP